VESVATRIVGLVITWLRQELSMSDHYSMQFIVLAKAS